ncbi:MAG: hypothetical protein WCW01_01895 [Gammaproteobacteria bacterium]|jgi:hypothetical protein
MLRTTLAAEQKTVVDIATAAMLAKQELSKIKQRCCLCFWMKPSTDRQTEASRPLGDVLLELGVYQIIFNNNVVNASSSESMRGEIEKYVLGLQHINLTGRISAAERVINRLQEQNLSTELQKFITAAKKVLPAEANSEKSCLLAKK